MAIQIKLENFSGPLDLLLHLIKSHEMDICDIRIVEITEQYLTIIKQMKQLDLDVAGEFLLMAATLIHIKSRLLLPVNDEVDSEEEDPRAELVKRLLEYQRFKKMAELFQEMPQLNRDIFANKLQQADIAAGDSEEHVVMGIYHLVDAFHRLLKDKPAEVFHEVIRESLSVADYIDSITAKLTQKKRISFREFFPVNFTRNELIVSFLATLELVKMGMVRIEQVSSFSEIWMVLVGCPKQLSGKRALLEYG